MIIVGTVGTPAGVAGTAPSLESGGLDVIVQRGESLAQGDPGDNAGSGDPSVAIGLGTRKVPLETGRPRRCHRKWDDPKDVIGSGGP